MPVGGARGSLVNLGQGRGPSLIAAHYVPFLQPARYVISGITKDSAGTPLGGCTVEVYEVAPGIQGVEPPGQYQLRGITVSDGNGNYSLDVTDSSPGRTFQAKAYLTGSPDVGGVTVNTLVGTSV